MPGHKFAVGQEIKKKSIPKLIPKPLASLCGRIVPKKAKVLLLVTGVQ